MKQQFPNVSFTGPTTLQGFTASARSASPCGVRDWPCRSANAARGSPSRPTRRDERRILREGRDEMKVTILWRSYCYRRRGCLLVIIIIYFSFASVLASLQALISFLHSSNTSFCCFRQSCDDKQDIHHVHANCQTYFHVLNYTFMHVTHICFICMSI